MTATSDGSVAQALEWLVWSALVGLPIAAVFAFLLIAPILERVMQRPMNFARAAALGGLLGGIAALLSLVWSRWQGWNISDDPSRYRWLGSVDNPREIDGILTAYGWQSAVQNAAMFILWCVLGALVIRSILGAGRENHA